MADKKNKKKGAFGAVQTVLVANAAKARPAVVVPRQPAIPKPPVAAPPRPAAPVASVAGAPKAVAKVANAVVPQRTAPAAPAAPTYSPYVRNEFDTEMRGRTPIPAAPIEDTELRARTSPAPSVPAAGGEMEQLAALVAQLRGQPLQSGLGSGYDSILNTEQDANADRYARSKTLESAMAEALAAILGQSEDPRGLYDDEMSNYKNLYADRAGERKALFDEEQRRIMEIYDQIRGSANGQYNSTLASIAAKEQAGLAGVGSGVAATRSALDAQRTDAQAEAQRVAALIQSNRDARAADAAKYGLTAAEGAATAAGAARSSSALPPEVLDAIQRDASRGVTEQAASSRSSASGSYNAAIERILQDMADTTSQSYGRFQTNGNDLLERYGQDIPNFLSKRSASVKDNLDGQTNAVSDVGELLRKIIDSSYGSDNLRKQALSDIASGQRNTEDNVRALETNAADNARIVSVEQMKDGTTRWKAIMSDGTQREIADMNELGRMLRNEADNATELAKPSSTKTIKGDQALRYLNLPAPQATYARKKISEAEELVKSKQIVDTVTEDNKAELEALTGKKLKVGQRISYDNEFYRKDAVELAKQLAAIDNYGAGAATSSPWINNKASGAAGKSTIDKAIDAYFRGVDAAPLASAASGGVAPIFGGNNTPFRIGSSDLVGRVQQAIARQESGHWRGDPYKAKGPLTKYGYATGRYQFLDSTWQSYGGSTRRAMDASPEEQDRIARKAFAQLLQRYNGNAELVAIAWHAGPGRADAVAAGKAKASQFVDKAAGTNSGAYSSNVKRWVGGK